MKLLPLLPNISHILRNFSYYFVQALIITIISHYWLFYSSLAWDGVDSNTNEPIEIGKGNYVSYGQDIEFYDYNTNQYHDAEVYNLNPMGNITYVELFDKTLNKKRTLIME